MPEIRQMRSLKPKLKLRAHGNRADMSQGFIAEGISCSDSGA